MSEMDFTITMEQVDGFEFKVRFDWDSAADLVLDEPEPIGERRGPNASRLVAAAVGNCLTASLAFCLQRSRVDVSGFETTVTAHIERNQQSRLRIGGMKVRIAAPVTGDEAKKLERCLGLFEDFCVVTASVRQGIPVDVEVVDSQGNSLFES